MTTYVLKLVSSKESSTLKIFKLLSGCLASSVTIMKHPLLDVHQPVAPPEPVSVFTCLLLSVEEILWAGFLFTCQPIDLWYTLYALVVYNVKLRYTLYLKDYFLHDILRCSSEP